MIKLSIILPCYNVSKYISRCLDTILAIGLSKDEYEILCVNDCSTDNTSELLLSLKSQYDNLFVYSQSKNVGPGACRNLGLQKAKGEYVWFVDADDTIEPSNISALLNSSLMNKLDVLLFNYSDLSECGNNLYKGSSFNDSDVMGGVDFVDKTFGDSIVYHMGYPVRFLCRRMFLMNNNILFPENMRYGEDTVWMPKILLTANKVQSSRMIGYYYWHREDSTCGQFDNIYPARTIIERCFLTSRLLFDFAEELNISKYSNILCLAAKTMYLNRLSLYLCRTTKGERKLFYQQIESIDVVLLKKEMTLLTKLVLLPGIGRLLSEIIAYIYQKLHE